MQKKIRTFDAKYNYYQIDGGAAIGSGLSDAKENQLQFVSILKGKYKKYEKEISNFDELVILADTISASGAGIDCIEYIHFIEDSLKQSVSDIHGVTFSILWEDDCSMIKLTDLVL